jgi:tetratricopeptide (TPR) repeat protein
MRLLKQVKKGPAPGKQDPKRAFIRWRENRDGEGPTRENKFQRPLWKQILLVCLVGVSIMVVAAWAVFTIKPTLLISLKGRVADQKSSPTITEKNPAPLHPTLAARAAKTRIVPTSAPTKPTVQQPKTRIATTIEKPQVSSPPEPTRPQVRIPSDTTEPARSMPSPPPRPQVSTAPSSSSTVEDDIVEEYLEIGSLYAQKGKYDKAEELFLKVTKENPSSAEAHNNLGFVYLKEERYELAEKEFKEALRLDPASVLPYYNMACLYSRKGMEVEALIYLKRALKRDARVKLWAITDEDFDGLRSDVVFQELLGISSENGEEATR